MNAQTISIKTTGDAQIVIDVTPRAVDVLMPRIGPRVPLPITDETHTKVLADGTKLPGSSSRTDHVAVIDHATGLMWGVKSIGDSDGDPMNQAACEKACSELRLLGHDDWRLPTRSELVGLVDDTRHEPAIDTSLFPGVLSRWHWTSTAAAWSPASAWYVGFSDGGLSGNLRDDGDGFALAVRRAGQ